MAGTQNPGRGWHGDPQGHAKAGAMSSGKFEKGSERARKAGRESSGKFEKGSERARTAGRVGGSR